MKILITAGEPSGDIHAALLMREIKKRIRNVTFYGIGGQNMEQEGLQSIVPMQQISVVGFVEVLKNISLFLKLKKQVQAIIQKENIDLFIPIDYPGFNIKIAKFAKKHNIPVLYYIAPQLWAWGKNRWKKLKNCTDEIMAILPFEENYFRSHNLNATFVGHPLLDNPIYAKHNEKERQNNLIAFFPGSRQHEVESNLSLFAVVAKQLAAKNPQLEFAFSLSPNVSTETFALLKQTKINYSLHSDSIELMQTASVGVVKAGTTTLQAALLNLPFVTAYKASYSHYNIGRRLVNLPYISLPNIIAERFIVPEFIQTRTACIPLVNAILDLLEDKNKQQEQQNAFNEIRTKLGEKSASENAAEIVLKYEKNNPNF